jgi:hypothetical protein
MRTSHRAILCCFALSFAAPLGAGCKGGSIGQDGFGGGSDPSTSDLPNEVSVVATGGFTFPPGVWLNHYGDVEDQHATAMAVNDDGDIALTGTARGTIDLGNIPWPGGTKDTDVFVAKISHEGQAQWSRRYGDSCDQRSGAVAHAPAGSVLVAGDFCGKMSFGATSIEAKTGEVDAFVALIDTLGEDVYSRRFGGAGAQIVRAAAVDPDGNAVIVGSFDTAFDDGSGAGAVPSAGMDDVFVLELDPKGKLLWSLTLGGAESDVVAGVAVDAKGTIVLGGSFAGTVDFGGGPLVATAGHRSGFVVELDPTGKHAWSQVLGGDDDAAVTGIAVRPAGTIAATGYFRGTIDLGMGPQATSGDDDVFLTTMAADGTPAWSTTFGAKGSQRATAVTFGAFGDVAISGTTDTILDIVLGNVGLVTPAAGLNPYLTYAIKFNSAGTPANAWTLDSASEMESVGIGFDKTMATYLAGSFQAPISLLSPYVSPEGGWDVFVARNP